MHHWKKMDCCQKWQRKKSCRSMQKAKSENVVEHPVYGSEDMEELRQCVLIDLEDCMTKDRETGEKGEALCMTFQNEEGKYIIIKHTITNLFFIFKA